MEYLRGVFARLMNWGTPLLAVGAIVVYGSDRLAARFFAGREKASLLLKAAGGVLALIGALRMLTLI